MGEKAWSLNTSIRNPDRVPGFLKIFSQFEGEEWKAGNKTQENYFIKCIQEKEVESINGMKHSSELKNIYKDESSSFTLKQAQEIGHAANYVGGLAMRGRQHFSVLENMGLITLKDRRLKITPIGKAFLSGEISEEDYFINYMHKLQGPIPEDKSFNEKNGFNIRLLPSVLYLIDKVNQKWKKMGNRPVGLFNDEFCIFVPFLKDYRNLDSTVEKVIQCRLNLDKLNEKSEKKEFLQSLYIEKLQPKKDISEEQLNKSINSFRKDYGDNIQRYLRKTGYFRLRGYKNFDISQIYINQLKYMINDPEQMKPKLFDKESRFYEYMADITSYQPPWSEDVHKDSINKEIELVNKAITDFSLKAVGSEYLEKIANRFVEMTKNKKIYEGQLLNEIQFLDQTDIEFKGLEIDLSKELEFRSFASIASINDLIKIEPTYKSSEDLIPRSFTPEVPDLTSTYKSFGLVTEVTMLRAGDQWKKEADSVPDHYYKFCKDNLSVPNYCLFIAPTIHERTYQHFYTISKYNDFSDSLELDVNLNIIPLSFTQWSKVLMYFVNFKNNNNKDDHKVFLDILNSLSVKESTKGQPQWIDQIHKEIESLKVS
ncbi:AlwI family type II restriction endonuclease [Acidimicrobiia bacterium]|nr:AlwI family type II restriction endonuclease [Acidimicrobiia bacterium]